MGHARGLPRAAAAPIVRCMHRHDRRRAAAAVAARAARAPSPSPRSPPRLGSLLARASSSPPSSGVNQNPRAARLRALLANPPGPHGLLLGPCCHDALSARLIQDAGFDFAFMSGFCVAAAKLAAPDTGLISYGEMVEVGASLHEATNAPFPIVGDGDTGYGNAMNVRRTVRGYAAAGFAGVLIEDQVAPKSCGHVEGKRVVGRDEAVARVRAAADARDESGSGIVLIARSDARQAAGLDEALWRARAFARAGADVVFVDALESEAEMRAVCAAAREHGALAMANMLEGGGKTPLLAPEQLAGLGFSLVAYPLSLLGVSIRAMRSALEGLKEGRVPPAEALGTFADIQSAVGFSDYFRDQARYAVSGAEAVLPAGGGEGSGGGGDGRGEAAVSPAAAAAAAPTTSPAPPPPAAEAPAPEVVEADAVVEGVQLVASSSSGRGGGGGGGGSSSSSPGRGGSSSGSVPSSRALEALKRSRFFRVTIRDRATGTTKLETRIPASFVGGLAALVPQVAGVDVDALLSEIAGGGDVADDLMRKPLVDVDAGGDRVQVFLE